MDTDTLRNLEKAVLELPSQKRLSALSDLARLETMIERANKRECANNGNEPIITTLKLAARHYGVSLNTIRKWVEKGILNSKQERSGSKVFVIIPPNLILTKKQMEDER